MSPFSPAFLKTLSSVWIDSNPERYATTEIHTSPLISKAAAEQIKKKKKTNSKVRPGTA